MKKNGERLVDVFFVIAVFICCIVMISALTNLIISNNYFKNTINSLTNNYEKILNVKNDKDGDINDGQIKYLEDLIDYTIKLQDLESNNTSNNIITFIYTFLSGTLIGIATYFTKKSADNVSQIEANKELIINLDNRMLFTNFYMYAQRISSTMQIFSVSLDAIQEDSGKIVFADKYTPQLNELINDFKRFAETNQNSVNLLSKNDRQNIREEINGIENLIAKLNDSDEISYAITPVRILWEEDLDRVKSILV